MNNLISILEKYEIKFDNESLLKRALTHSSYANENNLKSYERLEFLGDSVLQITVSSFLFENFLDITEGDLTKKRASFVCEEACVVYAEAINLKQFINVSKSTTISKSIIADVFESLLGAIYLDKGLEETYKILDCIVFPKILDGKVEVVDYKSTLQEYVQSNKQSLVYKIIEEKGPSHAKEFTSAVFMDDIKLGEGTGKTKKDSEQEAAKVALSKVV